MKEEACFEPQRDALPFARRARARPVLSRGSKKLLRAPRKTRFLLWFISLSLFSGLLKCPAFSFALQIRYPPGDSVRGIRRKLSDTS